MSLGPRFYPADIHQILFENNILPRRLLTALYPTMIWWDGAPHQYSRARSLSLSLALALALLRLAAALG